MNEEPNRSSPPPPRLGVRTGLLFALVLLTLAYGYFRLLGTPLLMDERLHAFQIQMFHRGEFRLLERLEMLPTLHFFYALLLRLFRSAADANLRFCSTVFGALFLAVFYSAAKRIDAQSAGVKLLTILFSPVLFPFLFLLYTDVPALLFLTLGIWSAISGKPAWSSVAGFVAAAIRQNHLPWLFYIASLGAREDSLERSASFSGYFRRYWYFAFALLLFLGGFIYLGSFSLHPVPNAPATSLSVENLVFLFALLPLLYFPHFCTQVRAMGAELEKPLVIAGAVGIIAYTLWGFSAPHPYNMFEGHLRTYFFIAVRYDVLIRVGFASLAGIGFLYAKSLRFHQEQGAAIALFTILSLLPFSLIEQRYLLPSIAFATLFLRLENKTLAWIQVGYSATLSLVLFEAIASRICFP